MMDRDYPMTRAQARRTVGALAVCAVVGLLLFGGLIPGLKPDYRVSPTTTFDGRTYYWTLAPLPIPLNGGNVTLPVNFSLANVTFVLWMTNWSIVGGSVLNGNATEPNGTVYHFSFGGFYGTPHWTDEYVSPGGAVAVVWRGQILAELLVLA